MEPQSRILVVDDDYPIAKALKYLFVQSGYECRVAHNGVEALEKIEEEKPDLVILDLQMPRLDGISTCRKIRENEDSRDLPVLVLT